MRQITFEQWASQFGIAGLRLRRPYVDEAAGFIYAVQGYVMAGRMSKEGAWAAMRIAEALTRGFYYVVGDEADKGDIESRWYTGELHVRCRLLTAVLGAMFRRSRSWTLPETGMVPVLLRGAEAARERLRNYDPAVMSKSTTTNIEEDLKLILENLRWQKIGAGPVSTAGGILGGSGGGTGGGTSGIMSEWSMMGLGEDGSGEIASEWSMMGLGGGGIAGTIRGRL